MTSSLPGSHDALVVGDSFQYIVTLAGPANAPETFEVMVDLPELGFLPKSDGGTPALYLPLALSREKQAWSTSVFWSGTLA